MAHERTTQVLIVEARFYAEISDALLEGAIAELDLAGARYERVTVPGALEIPAAIAFAHAAGRSGRAPLHDAYVALGCVIRGETSHYDIVAGESSRGLMDLAVHRRLAIGNGILTVENDSQAWSRARRKEMNKGAGAAEACLAMVALKRQPRGAR